jgi:hypothetical protein
MQVLVALTVGLVAWIVLWAFGFKAVDGFMLVILLTLTAAVARMIQPFVEDLLKP